MMLIVSAMFSSPMAANAQAAAPNTAQQSDPTLAPAPQAAPEKHGRRYKAPPVTSHIEVTVYGGFNGTKPLTNAAVIFHPLSDLGKDEGSYEVKTDPDGKAMIDVIPQGTTVILQVIAPTYNTFGDTYKITDLKQTISVKMLRPRTQYSVYSDDHSSAAQNKPGIQEPGKATVPTPPPTAGALQGSSAANPNAVRTLTGVPAANTNGNTVPAAPSSTSSTTTTPPNQTTGTN
jgi:hypothetical protein